METRAPRIQVFRYSGVIHEKPKKTSHHQPAETPLTKKTIPPFVTKGRAQLACLDRIRMNVATVVT